MNGVDSSIPLSTNLAPGVEHYLSLADMANRVQQQRQAMAGQNALREVFSQPGAVDSDGNISPRAVARVGAVDPASAFELRRKMLEDQVQRVKLHHEQTEAGAAKFEHMTRVAGIAYDAYTAKKKAGGSEQDALAAARQARAEAIADAGGIYPPEEAQRINSSPFDPQMAPLFAAANKQWSTRQEKVETLSLEERRLGEEIRSHKARERMATEGGLDADTISSIASQYLAGDKSVLANIGRGVQGAADLRKVRGEIARQAAERGMGGADVAAKIAEFAGITSGERALGTRTAQVGMASFEASALIPLAQKASDAVNRTKYPTLNAVLQAGERGTGDENVVRLGIATNSLINVYARAISPTGVPTVSDKDHARELLSTAWSNGQYSAGLDQLNKEIQQAQKSPGAVRQEFRDAVAKGSAPVSDAIPTTPPAYRPSPSKVTRGGKGGQLPDSAKAALKEGYETTFKNGQVWTLKNGEAVRVR